jgi:rubrerythrin
LPNQDIKDALTAIIKILNKGIMMEHNARTFYLDAAAKTKSTEGKKLLEWLADFETGHEARLTAKKNELASHPAMSGVHIEPLADYKVSETGGSLRLLAEPSETDILKVAIENEKKAYTFFQKKVSFSENPTVENLFKEMAHEEERHIEILNEQLKSLRIKNLWIDMQEFDDYMKDRGKRPDK